MIVAALFVETGGCYTGLTDVDAWTAETIDATTLRIERDARDYRGPHPVVAHPPCERWGRFHHGSTRKPHQYRLGEDGGCFATALTAARLYGGVIEHPMDSKAWAWFGIKPPPRAGGWVKADEFGGWTCCVDQGRYGHFANKMTWLYAVAPREHLPEFVWGKGEQRLHPVAVERYGYEKARRIGMVAMIGGKHKKRIRNATPEQFRDALLRIARAPRAIRRAA